jgi:Xaa-Pro dipeptidase
MADKQLEIQTKIDRIITFLKAEKHQALLIRRNDNLAWVTAGSLQTRVLLASETNVAAILVTADGKRFFLTTNNEAPRLEEEDFLGLGFEPIIISWHGNGFDEEISKVVGAGAILTDIYYGNTIARCPEVRDLTPLRTPLLESEIIRYRALGEEVASITSDVLHKLQPGMSESQMNALVASGLWQAGIEPSVLLMAVDERILKYKHAVGHGQTLLDFGMVNLCARRHGLCISITRFVHFGLMPQKLVDAFGIAAEVNAALQAATREGATAGDLYRVAHHAYAKAGSIDEEEQHHQGGAAGYVERDWIATPFGHQLVVDAQAFAWNPSIRGGKVEDTVLLRNGAIELLTPTPHLPQVRTSSGGHEYVSAGVLLR